MHIANKRMERREGEYGPLLEIVQSVGTPVHIEQCAFLEVSEMRVRIRGRLRRPAVFLLRTLDARKGER